MAPTGVPENHQERAEGNPSLSIQNHAALTEALLPSGWEKGEAQTPSALRRSNRATLGRGSILTLEGEGKKKKVAKVI